LPHFQSISVQKRGESISLARKAAAGARKKRELAQQQQQRRPADMSAPNRAADEQTDERIPSQVAGVVARQNVGGNLSWFVDNIGKASLAASEIAVNGACGSHDFLTESASIQLMLAKRKKNELNESSGAQKIIALHRWVENHGDGRWAVIVLEFAEEFDPVRISVDLKDKWRNLAKAAKAVRGVNLR
jgi:hypothetical protein